MFNRKHKDLFDLKVCKVMQIHNVATDGNIFSPIALDEAQVGDWRRCAFELQKFLQKSFDGMLSDLHGFIEYPYVRTVNLPEGDAIKVCIINEQSLQWYGGENAIGAFDFLYENSHGHFAGCDTFLDLGGHQLIWSAYYARLGTKASVTSFEPSPINCIIGLFNLLINGVIDRVELIPFAVEADLGSGSRGKSENMLVDYMMTPLKTCYLREYAIGSYDFIKTDIEGYEYELLSDKFFRDLIKLAKRSHFELHLGHLIKRGVLLEDCIAALSLAGVSGKELYSGRDMYEYLNGCDRHGFYSFLIN